MTQSDKAMRDVLRELVSELNRHKSSVENLVMGWGFVAGALSCAAVVRVTYANDFPWWGITGIGLVVFFIVAFGIWLFQDPIAQRQTNRTAARIKQLFPNGSDEFSQAVELLRGVTTEAQGEKDLLKALGAEVVFADEAPNDLLGEMEKARTGTADAESAAEAPRKADQKSDSSPPERRGYIPLAPYERNEE